MPNSIPAQPCASPAREPAVWGGLLVLFALLYAVDLALPRDFWVQDEARYGEVVREMLAHGHWLIPHLNGFPYPDKPPLYFWLTAAVGALVGHSELAFRLVSVTATLLAALGVGRVARQLGGAATAGWSVALFLTLLISLTVGHIIRMDMPLTAAAVWAWVALLRRQAGGDAGSLVAFWALTALTVALKGPIGLLFTVLPALAWLLWNDARSALRILRPLAGLGALVLLGAAWAGAVIMAGQQDYLLRIWNEQLLGRAIRSWSHREPAYFYLALLPVLLMPWTGLVVQGVRQLASPDAAPLRRMLIAFVLLPLAGLSAISGKLFVYLEPLMPGVAVIGGLAAVRLRDAARVPLATALAPALFCAALAAGLLWLAQQGGTVTPDLITPATAPSLIAPATARWLAAGCGALALLGLVALRLDGRRWLYAWLIGSVALNGLLFGALAQALDPVFSPRALGRFVAAHALADAPVGAVNVTRGVLNVYAARRYTELGAATAPAWLARHPDALLIVHERDVPAVIGEPARCALRARFIVELKVYRVFGSCTH